MTIEQFIEYNFAPFIGLVFQLVFLLFEKTLSKRERYIYIGAFVLEALELISYNLEYVYSEMDHITTWRYFFSIAGYILRPAMVYPFILLMRDDSTTKLKSLKYLDLIPFVYIFIIYQTPYVSLANPDFNLVFRFIEGNHFERGVLGYSSQVVTILYIVELSFLILERKFIDKKANMGIIFVVLLYIVSAMVLESIFSIRSLGISSCVFSVIFFMFSNQSNYLRYVMGKLKRTSEIDSLSQLYNRYAGEKKINEYLNSNVYGTFIILDVDKFKYINDTYGHSIGDEAIQKVSQALKDIFSQEDDIVMRLGGDEFAVYSPHINENNLKEVELRFISRIDEIRLSADMNHHISCSFGCTVYDSNVQSNFDTLYKDADKYLYLMKKSRN